MDAVLFATMKTSYVVVIDPEIMSGTPCFAGTRVPVRNLLDYLEGGDTLDEFLAQFPTVSREQAVAFLRKQAGALGKFSDAQYRFANSFGDAL